MPCNLHIVKTSDFVRLDGKGEVDVESTHDALAKLARTCVERGINCALLDVRGVQSKLSLVDVYRLAKAFNEMGFRRKHRLAILHRYRAGERAEFFAICTSARGWHVRAFEEYEHAIDWFTDEHPAG